MFRSVVTFFAVVFLATASAALADQTTNANDGDKYAAIHSIGVISAIGDLLNVAVWGPFNIHRGMSAYPIESLKIDDEIENLVSDIVRDRFTITPVPYDRAAFTKAEKSVWGLPCPQVEKLIRRVAAPVDAFLVISKGDIPYGVDPSDLNCGLNIMRSGEPVESAQFDKFLFVDFTLIDAKSYKVLARAKYPPPISMFWGGQVKSTPLDGALWPDSNGHFTDDQLAALKRSVMGDLDTVTRDALRQMGLSSQTNSNNGTPAPR